MAAKRDVNSEMHQGDTDESNTVADDVDALVSSFLAKLTDITSEMAPPPSRQPEPTEGKDSSANGTLQVAEPGEVPLQLAEVEKPQPFEAEKPQPSEIELGVHAEPNLDLQEIRDEVEETLIELERLKSEGVSTSTQKESRPVSLPPPVAEPKKPAAVSAPKQDVKSWPGFEDTSDEEGPTWDRLEVFRTRIVSVKSARRRKAVIFALVPAILAVILGSFFLSHKIVAFFKSVASTFESREAAPVKGIPGSEALPAEPKVLLPESRMDSPQTSVPAKNLTPERAGTKVDQASKQISAGKASSNPASQPKPANQMAGTPSGEKPKVQEPSPRRESQTASGPSEKAPPPAASLPAGASSQPTPPVVSNTLATARPKKADEIVIPIRAEVITKVQPVYPLVARTQRISGTVELDVEINEKGNVVSATPISGPEPLRGAAEEAVLQWKFKPASFNGVNMSSRARISVAFSLK